ncbi:MAG: COG4280 domain-containing protein [Solirubrobacteraceae bacterium]
MSGAEVALALSVLAACAVEAVEALTIVLAVGSTRSWRSALEGTGAAVLALAVITAALGPAVTALPIGVLRVVVGGLLLVFGLQWLRKAILRASGLKALHDEERAFASEREAARGAGSLEAGRRDGYSFTVAFKGVLLEGLEVVFIVLTFGSNQHDVGLAAIAAGVAVVAVALGGIAAHAPLSRVPENTLKFGVGVMLTSFGTFWGTEGAGAHWPGGDAALLVIVPSLLVVSVAMVAGLRRLVAAGPRGAGPRAAAGA